MKFPRGTVKIVLFAFCVVPKSFFIHVVRRLSGSSYKNRIKLAFIISRKVTDFEFTSSGELRKCLSKRIPLKLGYF